MLKPKQYDLEDSNVEGLGGEEDRNLRKAVASKGEPAWKRWESYLHATQAPNGILLSKEAVKDRKGKAHHVEIWRIEKFKVKFWPREQHGQFFTGDSYIILHTFMEEDQVKYDLHFWLGAETTQDEMGTAAYKTVELDTLLDDRPVQRREVQGSESQLFMDIFTEYLKCGGVRYNEGGCDSGFRSVKPEEYKPRLLHLKGRKKIRTQQVEMSINSLNSGDLFILDNGTILYCWIGKEAGMFEKNKGREVCDAIKTERKGKIQVFTLREGETDEHSIECFKLLGGNPTDPIKSAAEGGADEEAEKVTQKVLFRLSDATGKLAFSKEAEGDAVTQSKLDSNDVFIVDVGFSIYAWTGKKATLNEKNNAIPYATQYLNDYKRPMSTPIVRVCDGAEPKEFLALLK